MHKILKSIELSQKIYPNVRGGLTQSIYYSFAWKPNVPKYENRKVKDSYYMEHPIWDQTNVTEIKQTHLDPKDFKDKFAYRFVRFFRRTFDLFSGFTYGKHDEETYMRRFIFLETIASVPGMVGAMMRHLKSVRTLNRDKGWIHHLLGEAENERMHLFTFLDIRKPGRFFRFLILSSQFIFITIYSTMYLLSSKVAHRFVGYIEEEAVKTYSSCLKELDEGKLPGWIDMKAPKHAKLYWDLAETATFRDVLLAIRADEVMHREVNHRFADLKKDELIDSVDPSAAQVENMAAEKVESDLTSKIK